MAQLISFDASRDPIVNDPTARMPNVPAFQFWASRNYAIGRAGAVFGLQPTFPEPQTFTEFVVVTCIANTAHAANHKTVKFAPFDPILTGSTAPVFELTDDGTHTGSNIPVVIANGDTAAQVATALAAALTAFFSSNFPNAFVAVTGPVSFGPLSVLSSQVLITAEDPGLLFFITTGIAAGGVAPPLTSTKAGGVMYGQALLARAWASFVYTGYGAQNSFFEGVGPTVSQQIPVAMYPLAMRGPKAWPGQLSGAAPWQNPGPG
jgi:hypothetical protein